MADALRKEPGLDVEMMDGGRGEFTVSVDGRMVVPQRDELPTVDEVRDAVHQALPAHA